MFYRKNVAPTERAVRAVAGGLMIACAWALAGATPLGWLMAGAGVMTVVTGMVGFCPACAMAGRRPIEGPPR